MRSSPRLLANLDSQEVTVTVTATSIVFSFFAGSAAHVRQKMRRGKSTLFIVVCLGLNVIVFIEFILQAVFQSESDLQCDRTL